MSFLSESYGDNKEFGVDGTQEVTVYFTKIINDVEQTSANDTETKKYFNNGGSCRTFTVRSDKNILISEIDNVVMTDPITVVTNKAHKEDLDMRKIFKIVLRTNQSSGTMSNIKVRWRG